MESQYYRCIACSLIIGIIVYFYCSLTQHTNIFKINYLEDNAFYIRKWSIEFKYIYRKIVYIHIYVCTGRSEVICYCFSHIMRVKNLKGTINRNSTVLLEKKFHYFSTHFIRNVQRKIASTVARGYSKSPEDYVLTLNDEKVGESVDDDFHDDVIYL